MKLAEMTWQDVRDASRQAVVLIPTGSNEQHGPHLPLWTDSFLATAAAEAIEREIPEKVILTSTLWLGASGHHLKFPGTLSASFDAYGGAIHSIVESLVPHGFTKFFILNGHGGNTEPNGIALRELKARYPGLTFAHSGYFSFIPSEVLASVMEGPAKEIRHACEAEASLMLHLHPDLVRKGKLRDDGLKAVSPLKSPIHHFDEITEEGSLGYATLATSEKGKALFEAAVEGATREIQTIADGYSLQGG